MDCSSSGSDLTQAHKRIAELEAEVAELKARLEKRMNNNLERLREYRKANPEKVTEATKRWKETNRDAYNARRRELYRLKQGGGGGGTVKPNPETPGTL